MEPVKDAVILRLIEQISMHYRTNISNRFIRPALLQLSLDKTTWDMIEALTEKFEHFRYQGFHLDDLYRQLAAAAKFVYATRNEIAPTLRYRLASAGSSGAEKVLRDLAVNNFSHNLKVFSDLLYELYIKLAEIDITFSKGKRPLYEQMPELGDIGVQLTGR